METVIKLPDLPFFFDPAAPKIQIKTLIYLVKFLPLFFDAAAAASSYCDMFMLTKKILT
jgi:hypothetical protein